MNKNRKGFDWYASRQRFSIRKFHFGAASILLGLSLAMTAGQEVSANTTESEDLGNLVSEVVDVNETESISSNQREVVISYVVDYVDESGQIISHQVYQHEQETAEALATAVITMTAQVPEGYILSEGQSSSLLQTISEGAENRICFKVRQSTTEEELIDSFEAIPQDENPINSNGVEKEKITETELLEEDSVEAVTPELDQGVPKEATVEKEQASPTMASGNLVLTVNELPPLPTDLPAAKEVFEQVASEATVLASEGERLIASKETNNDKLKTAVAETKQVVVQAQEDLIASLESLDRMHQQITAIREKVNLLAVELRKISPDGEITVLLSSTSNIASGANNEATDGSDATFFTGPQHYRNFDEADLNKIKRQITWLDFGDRTAWTGLDMIGSNPALRVGARYRKEISPGYVVEITVSELKPFESTDVYRDRVKGTDKEWTYNPNAVNSNMKTYVNGKTDYGNSARIIAAAQDQYSNAKVQGFDVPGLVTLRSIENFGNVGVKFTTKATYLGNVVPLNVVFMSGEEARNSEFETYTTNGEAFELFGELSNSNTVSSYKVLDNWLEYNGQDHSGNSADWKARFDGRYWANIATEDSLKTAKQTAFYRNGQPTKVVDGIGTKVFGPVSNHLTSGFSTPIIMTKNASEVGMYIMSTGRQSAMIGVALLDYGDAPDTYGTGAHAISLNQADKQPYLGSLPADIDFIPEGIPVGSAPWYRDELINQFDEGPSQLMGDRVQSGINYTLHHSNDGAYTLDFKANTNTHAKAYVQGWVDFNNDGRFDETENSGLIEIVSGKTDYKLHFRDIYQNVDPTVTRLGVRMRIALDAVDITTPYLTAYSGEVEDFQIQMTHPPRGSRVETSGNQGVTQNATVEFQAFGENRYSKTLARIDTTVEPQLVKDDGSLVRAEELDAQGYYVIPGEGKYKVTSIGSSVNVEFVPEADFITEYSDGTPVRQAKGISIRRTSTVTDDQGVAYTTGWHAITSLNGLENTSENVTVNGLAGTMDGRYIPHVVAVNPTGKNATSKDIQGAVQQGRPTFTSGVTSGGTPISMGYEVDASGQAITENTNPKYPLKLVAEDGSEVGTTDAFAVIDGVKTNVGTYSINGRTGEVTYTPNDAGKKYIGTVEAATVIARDVNGATAKATYTPTITPVSPTAEAATSVGLQGKEQKGIPVFEKSVTAPDGVADLVDTSLTLLDSDGNKVSSLIVDNQGTYTLNSDGSITFVPLPDFVGPAIPVKVQKTDTNGSSVTTTYTPVVVEVKPAGDPDESFGLKGQSQTSTTEFFEPGKIDLNGDRAYDPVSEIVPLDKSSIKLLDSSNAPVNEVSIDNQGTYRLNNDGSVTFTPLADFVGTATPIRVQMKDVNGTAVTTTYTPTVVEVPESELTETVTRTIHYVKADGSIASPSVTKTLEYTRTVDIDSQTGKISYGDWTSTDDDFPQVISPTIPNLRPDLTDVAARENVPGDAADETITVIYSGVAEQLATITYKILTGNSEVEVAKDGVQGQSGLLIHYSTEQRITAFEELGYELVSDGFTTAIDKNFDDEASIQNFDVILRPKIRTLIPNDPTNPVTPGQPVDPNDPTSPVLDKLIETVTRTVKYLDETNREVAVSPAPTNASFTRTATYNHVTKTISYSEWNSTDPVIEGNPLPVVTGYIATSASANGQAILPTAVEKDQTVRYNSDDVEEIVIYSQLGSWTPKVPEGFDPVPPIVYPNDPNDPTRPGEEIPTIPYIPGLVPKGPDGPLPPVDPEDPSKGYKVPPVPFDPTNDTPISYIKDTQKAEIVFVNVTNPNQPVILDRVALTGETGAEIGYDPTTKLAELTSAGYLVTKQPDYSPSQIYSRDAADTERFVYELIERIVPIDPSNPPIPGKPVDPTNPDGPKWPDAVKELVTSETVTRTITYVDKSGNQVFDTVTESKDFTRTAKVNLVTGEIEYGSWSASQELPAVPSPHKDQYIVDVKEVVARTVQATDEDLEVVVTYTPLGSWVTIVPPGTTPIYPIIYPNHPTDPTQPGSETPILPHIPSSSPLTPDIDHPGVFKPLLPVDPNDVTKGYHAPSVPTNPTNDTLIVYGTPGSQFATVTIKEQDSGNVLDVLFGQGKANEPVAISTDNKIEFLKKAGYELVSDAYNDSPKLFDTDDSSIQNWDIIVRPKVVTVTPDNPQTPGNPVEPENPDGPKWPDGLKESDLNKTVTRTILYKYEDESPVLADDGSPKVVRQTVSFYRTATVDLVNASVTYGEWSESQTVPAVDSPVISGYITDTSVVTALTVSANDSDQTVTVVYKKLGSWVPNIPGQPVTPIPYPNHPTDPTKPGDEVPTLPHVPGFIPVGPDGVTPLPPVDPDDPSKGYELPPIPTDPGVDTPITYVPEAPKSSTVTVKYVDESGKELIPATKLEGKVGDSYTSEGKVIEGYLLKEIPSNATGTMVEGGTVVTYVYVPIGSWVPNIPGQPVTPIPYPNHPTDPTKPGDEVPTLPHVPGFIPVGPDGVTPLPPVDPDDPSKGYELPPIPTDPGVDTPITYVPEAPKSSTVTVKYVDESGKELIPSTKLEGKVGDSYTSEGKVIEGYLLKEIPSNATGTMVEGGTVVTYVYVPIGSWVPNIPGQPVTPIPYPNHPTDPTKPGDEVPTLPHVPGFIPVGPDGVTPLPPVDPDDPSKGYELPPVPTDPGVDTPITYVPEAPKSSTVTVKYVDESGKALLPPVVTEGKVGDSYTSEGKVIEGYLLKEIPTNAIGTMVEGGTIVTYVYVPIGSWVPNIPGQPVTPIPYPNHPTDPTKPGDEVPTLPHVPGFIPVGPDGVTPLPPVDPDDPSKGYELPPIPTDPGVDTPITYVPEAPKSSTVTVKYVDESGKELIPSTKLEGKVGDSYTSEGKVIEGYLLKEIPTNATGTMVEGGTVVTYVYVPIGSWVPNIPGQPVTPIPYPNHPTDPTKPGDGVPTLPHVPGFIPVGPDGVTPLPPVDPDDPSKGYELPPIPTDPGVDTPITYVPEAPKSSTVTVKYVDESGKELIPATKLEGKVGDSYTSEGKVIEGYLLKEIPSNATGTMVEGGTVVTYVYVPIGSWVPNIPGQPVTPIPYPNHPTDPTKPGDEVPTLPHVPGFIPVGPDGVTPLPPVDPDDPSKGYELPPVPTDPGVDTPITYVPEAPKSSTVTVKYVDESGKALLPPVVTEGKVGDSYTSEGKVIEGYLLKEIPTNAIGTMVEGGTIVTYVYVPIGSWVPNIPGQPVTPIPYPNHPTDPTKPGDEVPTLPHVPGFIPVGPDGVTPLPPVDPDDPSKGYELPPIPTDPGVDTPITYVPEAPKSSTVTVKYVDESGKELIPSTKLEGKVGDSYTSEGKVIEGYLLKEIPTNATGTMVEGGTVVTYVYVPIGSWVPNIPGQPVTPIPYPNHPTDPTKPGDGVPTLPHVPGFIPVGPDGVTPLPPVDPDDPSKGYELPPIPTDPGVDTPITYVPEAPKSSTVTVKYVDESGKELIPATKLEGKVGDSYTSEGKVIEGYLLKEIPTNATGTMVEGGTVVTYVYVPIGSWVPNIPGQPVTPIPYPNHPTDPTKPGDEVPTLPHVPGFIPVGPDGVTPLPPVDPDDPSKGYELPPIPTDPGVDTPITYVPEAPKSSTVTVKYVDESGKDLLPPVVTEGKVGDSYTSEGKVIEGYLLKEVPTNATGTMVEGGTVVTYVYVPIGSWVPNIPGQPLTPIPYPNHPTDPTKPGDGVPTLPHVPGFIPVGPDGVTPLPPVDPEDPSKGYELPPIPTDPGVDTPITYVPEAPKSSTVTVKYVDESGKELIPSTKLEGKVGDSYTSEGKVIEGYLLKEIPTNATGTMVEGGTVVTYVYVPIGSWIPNIPGQPVTPIPYPNHPTDPTKPGDEVPTLPHVPGFIPVGPDGVTPLPPVDPDDPSKGYELPPIPTDPGVDTPITYVPEAPKVIAKPSPPKASPIVPSVVQPATKSEALPNTGEIDSSVLSLLGLSMLTATKIGLKKRRED